MKKELKTVKRALKCPILFFKRVFNCPKDHGLNVPGNILSVPLLSEFRLYFQNIQPANTIILPRIRLKQTYFHNYYQCPYSD